MGCGSWSKNDLESYVHSARGVSYDEYQARDYSAQEMYTSRQLNHDLDPKDVMRECCDTEEHPATVPVILALDVTGSMGDSAVRVAKKLGDIMENIYSDPNIKDVEFCVMGIGDLAYDDAPVQISQFESDIRIAEHLDKIYFEGGGGGNGFESYSAAWYMGLHHCSLDCWKRGKKGIIITLGDELPNPYLPARELRIRIGDKTGGGDVETKDLLPEAQKKFEIYHIAVDDKSSCYHAYNRSQKLDKAWKALLKDHYAVSNLDSLEKNISDIVSRHAGGSFANPFTGANAGGVSW